MTRWEFVGETTEHVLQYRNEWKIVAEHVVHVEKSGSTRHTIASYLLSYLREKMIMAHLYFLRSYIKCWWGKHFTWLKHVDPQTKTPGFLEAHIAVHYYVMHCDLENMINTWKTMDEFAEFRNEFPHDNSSYTADYLASAFFKRAKDRFHKHFKQWRDKYLHLALAGEIIPATYLAKWILGMPTDSAPSYYSPKHETQINVVSMILFLTTNNSPLDQRTMDYYTTHREAINNISEGGALWDNDEQEMAEFRKFVQQEWLITPTNT